MPKIEPFFSWAASIFTLTTGFATSDIIAVSQKKIPALLLTLLKIQG